MRIVTAYALSRLAFGVAALAAPATTGRLLAGEGGAAPDAQAFLRGMGGREVGLATGLLLAQREGASAKPWLLAGMLFDSGDVAGISGAWREMDPAKRVPGVAMAGAAAIAGAILLARE
jgi:hypothetical protein